MSQLLDDAVCGEAVPAWDETVDELDAEIKQCETLGWHAGPGSEWVTELRQYRPASDRERLAASVEKHLARVETDITEWLEACHV